MSESEDTVMTIKCMIVGDSATGKTHLFRKLTNQSVPAQYEPTVFDVLNMEVKTKRGSRLNLNMWDSAGDRVFDEIRPISYAHTDCFIICYAVNDKTSFDNIFTRWIPEIAQHGDGPTVPIIVVATKCDLKVQGIEDNKGVVITEPQEADIKEKCGARAYFKWSTFTSPEESSILQTAIDLAYSKKEIECQPADPVWRFASPTIIFLGDAGVGKSSLIQQCFYPSSKEYIKSKERYHNVVHQGCEYFLKLLSISRASDFLQYFQNEATVDLLVVCYAIDDPFSFQTIETLFQSHDSNLSQKLSHAPIILIGTKNDLKSMSLCSIPSIDGQLLSQKISSAHFIETSLTSSESISLVVEAIFERLSETSAEKRCKELF